MKRKLLLAACVLALAAPVMADENPMSHVSGTEQKTGSPGTGLQPQKNASSLQLALPGNAAFRATEAAA